MVTIRQADFGRARDLDAYHEVLSKLHSEVWPDNPPRTREELAAEIANKPDFVTILQWLAYAGDRPVGLVRVRWRDSEDNRHLCGGFLGVLPEHRRSGVASQLIAVAADAALAAGRTSMILDSDSRCESGAVVAERWGGTKGLVARISRLDLQTLDRDLMDAWVAAGEARGDEFELLEWGPDPVPDAFRRAFAELHDVMNSAPFEDLDMEPFELTVEQMDAYEASRRARGIRWWATVARHKPSGELAGFTELQAMPSDPSILYQGDTGVRHEYRGKGLGRWLKAANLLRVLPEMPEARWVETGNAGSNRPMLAINEAMGFVPYKHIIGWQFDVAALQARVTKAPAT